MRSRLIRAANGLCALALLQSPLAAQTVWTNGVGNWFDSTNWSAGIPNPQRDAEINNGGEPQITASGATGRTVTLGRAAGQSGTLSIVAQGSLQLSGTDLAEAFTVVGGEGSGVLNIKQGAVLTNEITFIAAGSGSSGVANVDGAGSRIVSSGDRISVGNSGSGTLNITTGGLVSGGFGLIGDAFGSTGSVSVDGAGSKWLNSNRLFVGNSGPGSLTITHGGAVVNTAGHVGGGGVTGTVNVIGAGSTWTNSSFVTISGERSDANIVGAVNISGGATVKSTTGTVAEYGSAAAEISGTGSSWTNSSDFAVGHLGRGRLKISGGGELANVSGFVAGEPQSTGAVRVDGPGSIWRNSGSLFVGHAGTGSLAISNGGSVRNVGGFVGHLTGARGRVMVEGAGSAWMNSGNVFIGGDIGSAAQRGRGSLRMRNGGTTSAYSVTVRRPGTLSGSGTINANTLTNNGIVAPGDRLGALRVNGDYTQNADGVLNIQIGGNTVGASYDQLQISGTATLVGTLNISVVDGYRPAVGDVFTVITAESVSGSFAHINAAGLTVQANYASGAVTLTVAALPDVLLNISTRLHVGTGDNALIGGFIITGGEPKRVIIRAIGPSLSKHGISGPLADPTLQLFDSMGEPIFFNDNWKESQQTEIENTGLAPSVEREAALVATLDPGNYTAIVRGKDHTTGVGLVEVYDLAKRARAKLANVSARGRISTGENVMIGGFITGGGTSNTRVLARALGPSLPAHGISDTLHNPVLELRDANGALVRQNDNWRESQQREIAATGIAPRDELEAALIATLSAANYTAVVRGKDQGTGVALIELYALE